MRNKPGFSLFCDCGCASGLCVNVLDGLGYVSFISGDFYTKQLPYPPYMLEKVVRTIKKERNPRILKDIIVKKDDLESFLMFLDTYITSDEAVSNDSKIKISYEDDVDSFSLLLVKARRLPFNKRHRYYDIALNKREVWRLQKEFQKTCK